MGAAYEGKDRTRKAVVDAFNHLLAVSNGRHRKMVDDELNGMIADVAIIRANSDWLGGSRTFPDEPDVLVDICDDALRHMAEERTRRTGAHTPDIIVDNPEAAMLHEFICSDLLLSLDSGIVGGLDAFIPYSKSEGSEEPVQPLRLTPVSRLVLASPAPQKPIKGPIEDRDENPRA